MDKIKFVSYYMFYNKDTFDVIYKSGRCCVYDLESLPNTVRKYIDRAKIVNVYKQDLYGDFAVLQIV